MTAKTVLILGGTSDIGLAIARVYADKQWRVILAARPEADVDRNVQDLVVRYGATAWAVSFDAVRSEDHAAFLDGLGALPDTVISVVGLLGNQIQAENDLDHAAKVLRTNFEGPALLLGELANRMVVRGSGTLVGVSSVAGDRGRASNYVYGAAKAGLTAFLSGLRNRLSRTGVHVLTVKPGFVRNRMTQGMNLPAALTAAPAEIGLAVFRAAEISRKDQIYVRPVWRLIMLVIRNIPERVFKSLKL